MKFFIVAQGFADCRLLDLSSSFARQLTFALEPVEGFEPTT